MQDIYYSEMLYSQKLALIQAVASGLPFTYYWIEKTLIEVNPMVKHADSVNSMYVAEGYGTEYLQKLIKNSFN